MSRTVVAFGIYGTLIDTARILERLQALLPRSAAEFAALWRAKQLEYTFRRTIMRAFRGFDVCARAALDYTDAALAAGLSAAQKDVLMDEYRRLPAYPDAAPALQELSAAGVRLIAFSNGVAAEVHTLLRQAGIREHFEDIVSGEEIRLYKPDPGVYAHLVHRACAADCICWVVSSQPYDVIGAAAAGLRAVWVQRGATAFDPWELAPTATIPDLRRLAHAITHDPARA
jgi:2-haloacid dehalogenase